MPMDTATMTGAAASSAAAQITARLDRLPATKTIWSMVLLISLGGVFEVYDLLFTGYIAPGLFRSGIFTATTVSFFGMTGLASFVASLFAGLFVGTIAFAYVADRFGRRAIFTYSLIWYSIATLALAFQNTPNMVNLWRFIGGVGIGVELVTIDAYISELVPKAMRGKAFAVSQGTCFFVVPLVALLAWLLVPLEPLGLAGWRWVVLIGSVGALCIWTVRRRLPESPRWLAQQGRIEEAERVMSAIEARASADIGRPLPPPGTPVIGDDRVGSYREIFSQRYRTRTIMLIVANFFSTIGFYGFVNWVPTLLLAKGINVTKSLEYTFIIALAWPVFPFISTLFADRMERKWQVVGSSIGIAVCGMLFAFQSAPVAIIIVGVVQTMLNTWISFSFHNYQAELFPTRMRARAVGFVYSWSRFSTIFSGFFIAFFLRNFGQMGVFAFIAAAMLIVAVAVAIFGPRTNQLALEEISR
ncbi:MAG: MFS transporter [Alphaproteobacteria bacterium]|nr:MFS transporter [Alphaproteobacteria bacterium]